ncbi:RluA family pseudouridine synthase [Lederbergia citrea]|uniref:RluA family pseudouridine synthase n=1 Tax=Lederbergia citrea TaxID=2833581 RepID=UPI001BC93C93|nr:RluA family pseudouridine synthase [Lederbergia citrea]MBS4177555.1 RluA family pseudouridine synthase [Lederbergia citrea]
MTKRPDNEKIQIIINKLWSGTAVQDLFRSVWQAPKKLVHELRMDKAVEVNGKTVNWTDCLVPDDILTISLPIDKMMRDHPAPLPFEVLFEDDHLLIVNKPAGMATHPNEQADIDTLVNAVAFYLQKHGDIRKVRHVHRLDKDTTGAVLFAKHALSHAVLDKMLLERKINRTYWALAEGIIPYKEKTINKPIGRDRHHPTRRRVSKSGQSAISHFRVIKNFPMEQLTLIECKLETGRTHQIRVHLSDSGHPLAGDILYGGNPIFPRLALHARELSFRHPFTLEEINVVAPFLDKPSIFDPYV